MPARFSSQFSAHVSGQVQGRISIRMPHTKQPRCNHRNTGRWRVTVTPNTTHRMNSRCNARITAANAEYTLPLPYAAFFCCALVLAQRARCAAAILLRAAWLIMRTGAGALLAPASHPCQQSFADDCLWLLAFICWDFGIYVIHRKLQLLFKLHEEQDEDRPHS